MTLEKFYVSTDLPSLLIGNCLRTDTWLLVLENLKTKAY